MAALKLFILALAFVVSGGILFSEYFRANRLVRFTAAGVAIVAFLYLVKEVSTSFYASPAPGKIEEAPKPAVVAPAETPADEVIVAPLATLIKPRALRFSLKDDQLIVVTDDSIIKWNPTTNSIRKAKHTLSLRKVAVSASGEWVIEANDLGSAVLINLNSDTRTALNIPSLPTEEIISKLAVSNSGTLLAIASYTSKEGPKDEKGKSERTFSPHLRLINLTTKKEVCHDQIWHSSYISDMAFSDDNRFILTGSWDSGSRLMDIACTQQKRLRGYLYTYAVALDSRGQRAASGAYDGIRFYRSIDHYSEGTSLGFTRSIEVLAFDPRGLALASGTESGWVYLFDSGTGSEMTSRSVHDASVLGLSFDGKGTKLASLGKDGSIAISDATNLKRLARINLFVDGEWAVLLDNGQICGSKDTDRWLRIRSWQPGRFWGHWVVDQPLSSDTRRIRSSSACTS